MTETADRPASGHAEEARNRYLPIADHGVVGDLHTVIPQAVEEINKRKG